MGRGRWGVEDEAYLGPAARRAHKPVKAIGVWRCGLAACALAIASTSAAARPIEIEAARVRLNAEQPALDRVGGLRFLGGLRLRSDDSRFGGLSGLSVSADGKRMVAVSDRGDWFTADLIHDGDGRLIDVTGAEMTPLAGLDGRPLAGKAWTDAEAVERLPDGGYVVSFERHHRLWRYAGPHRAPARRLTARAIHGLVTAPANGGIEAVAVLADGTLLAVTEDAELGAERVSGWLIEGDRIAALGYARDSRFKPTDFAVLPTGEVIALERRFIPPFSISARLRIIPARAMRAGATLKGREIARLERPFAVDNMEGLAAVPAADGGTLLYLLSDDNFNPLQNTILLMFRLAP